jgi:AraC family transcriptional regulator, regulatory protein of adaptative response / methylated-DNA-[protein]-cysteine methyltransferase
MLAVSHFTLPTMDPAAELNAPEDLIATFPGLIGTDGPLKAAWVYTPIGGMIAVCSDRALHMLEFPGRAILKAQLSRTARAGAIAPGHTGLTTHLQDELTAYFAGRLARFTIPLALQAPPFTRTVWAALQAVPYGTLQTYTEVARSIGRPMAIRAMARANAMNPVSILIPCHRVLGADGKLTGYGGGLWRKEWLIAHEARGLRSTA